jgi:hypothetical protein
MSPDLPSVSQHDADDAGISVIPVIVTNRPPLPFRFHIDLHTTLVGGGSIHQSDVVGICEKGSMINDQQIFITVNLDYKVTAGTSILVSL